MPPRAASLSVRLPSAAACDSALQRGCLMSTSKCLDSSFDQGANSCARRGYVVVLLTSVNEPATLVMFSSSHSRNCLHQKEGNVVNVTLGDLRHAVISYLTSKVSVSISSPVPTGQGLEFNFTVTVANTSEANGGVGLTNVRYQVEVETVASGIARILVPDGGSSIGPHGEPLNARSWVEFFNFDPSDTDLSYLQMGESHSLTFTGYVGQASETGFNLIANIQADPDINSVFPRNFTSSKGEISFSSPG
jgi:hypothetical protein